MNIKKEQTLYQLNALCILILSGLLVVAFYFQFVEKEEPCPLCLLQRMAIIGILFGLCLNSLYTLRAKHFAVVIIAALIGVLFATRQVLLHITMGSGAYGSAVFGLHMYTWSDIVFFCSIFCAACFILFLSDMLPQSATSSIKRKPTVFERWAVYLAIFLAAANVLSAGAECGLGPCCEDGPCPVIHTGSS